MPGTTLLERLRDSELLSAEQLSELASRKEAGSADPRALAKLVYERGWLTRYQINQIAAGRGKELHIAQYVILDRLGEGGMGQVLKARHAHMDRLVALKVVRKEKLSSATAIERFFKEVQAAARLTHPNIVIAFDAGKAGNTHYFSMEFVDGMDLAQLVRKNGPLSVRQACDFIRQAALGLEHAHEKGMVHRDIKPSNLLVTRGNSPVVKVLDMGLARLGDSFEKERGLTKMGQVIGTPDYLAPEQAIDARNVDIRADIYSLGCTLFYLLTGRTPYHAESLAELLLKHQMEAAPSLREVRPDAPPALEALLGRMMAKKPEQRPATPAVVVAALEPLARGERGAETTALVVPPVPPPPSIDDAWASLTEEGEGLIARAPLRSGRDRTRDTIAEAPRRRRDHDKPDRAPLLIGAGIGAGALLLLMTIFTAVLMSRSGDSDNPKKIVQFDRDKGGKSNEDGDLDPNAQEKGGKDKNKENIVEQKNPEPKPPVPEPGQPAPGPGQPDPTKKVPNPRFVGARQGHVALEGHTGAVLPLAVSPNGKLAASADVNKRVIVWDLVAEKELYRFDNVEPAGSIMSLAFSGDGSRLVGAGPVNYHEWDLATGKETTHRAPGGGVFLSPNAKTALRFGSEPDKSFLEIWDVDAGTLKSRIDWVKTPSMHAFDRTGNQLVVVGTDGNIVLIDLKDGKPVARRSIIINARTAPTAVCFGPDENELLIGRRDGFVYRVPLKDGAPGERIERRMIGPVRTITLSADGKTFLATCMDNDVHKLEVATRPIVDNYHAHTTPPSRALYCLEGKKAVSADGAGTVMLVNLDKPSSWSVPPGKRRPRPTDKPPVKPPDKPPVVDAAPFSGHTDTVRSIAVSRDSKYLVSGSDDSSVRLWNAATGKQVHAFSMSRGAMAIHSVCFSRDGSTVLAVGDSANFYAWETESGKMLQHFFIGTKGPAASVDISPDGEDFAVTAGEGFTGLRVFNNKVWRASYNRVRRVPGVDVNCVVSVNKGSLFALGYNDGAVRIADVRGSIPEFKLILPVWHKGPILALTYAPKTEVLLSGGMDKLIYLTSLKAGAKPTRRFLKGHEGPVTSLAVSPDGKQVVSGSKDKTIRVWDLTSRKQLFKFTVDDPVFSVAFAGDGRSAFSAGKRIRVWPLAPEERE
jgi:serine/threonine protein kinase/WD40 repeat protein